MKLLNKTQLYYLSLLALLLALWTGVFLYVISSVIQENIDETLQSELQSSITRLKSQQLSYFSSFGNKNPLVDIATIDTIRSSKPIFSDTTLYNSVEKERLPYRQVRAGFKLAGQPVQLTMRKSTVEYDDLFYAILLTELLFVVLLIIALYVMNRLLLHRLWKPFFRTLDTASNYRISGEQALKLPETNIREFAQLNDVLQDMIERIEDDYRSLKQFTENAAHEIQTPLSVIANKTEILLQDESLSAPQTEKLAHIHKTAGQLSRLNRALLTLTKIENNQYAQEENINLAKILHQLIPDYKALAQSKNISVQTDIKPGVRMNMNEELAELMLRNLLSNAVKHNIDGGTIKIALTKDRLIVQNTGETNDIPTNPQELFERFKKGSHQRESLGLGLSIAAAIVETSNLNISYEYDKSLHVVCLKLRSPSK